MFPDIIYDKKICPTLILASLRPGIGICLVWPRMNDLYHCVGVAHSHNPHVKYMYCK